MQGSKHMGFDTKNDQRDELYQMRGSKTSKNITAKLATMTTTNASVRRKDQRPRQGDGGKRGERPMSALVGMLETCSWPCWPRLNCEFVRL